MMGVQVEGHADVFVEICRPEDAADPAKIAEGHIDFRAARALDPVQSHAHATQSLAGAVDEENDAIFARLPEAWPKDREDFVANSLVHDGLAGGRKDNSWSIEVEGPSRNNI